MAFDADFGGIDDCDLDVLVQGAAQIAEAVGRRITTRPGTVFYDPKYLCVDLVAWQSRGLTDADLWRLRTDLERCIAQEERLASFTVDCAWYPRGQELRVTVGGETVDGETFTLTATVDGEGVQLAVALA